MKYVVVLGDGMADEAVAELGGKTPLDVAEHPTMDLLAQNGEFGLAQTVPDGMKPGSDTANLSVFGYDPRVYYTGRSPLEAMSLGVPLAADDVTYRCNFVTLTGDTLDNAVMTDYSAGEISTEEAAELVRFLNERLADDGAQLYAGFSYRHCLVLRHAETGAELTPPHDFSGKSTAGRLPSGTNEALLTEWMRTAFAALPTHPVNVRRAQRGQNPANAIWFWGEGRKPALTPFRELYGLKGAVVSAVDLIQGIGRCAGLDVIKVAGATGTYQTNFRGKAQAAIDALDNGADYVYIHLEAPDECGHHHQVKEKVRSIEQIDRQVLTPVKAHLDERGEPYTVLLMPDHPTPLSIMTHTATPVPYALYRKGDCAVKNVRYCEADAVALGTKPIAGHLLLGRMTGR